VITVERLFRIFVIVALIFVLANLFAPAVISWMDRHGFTGSQGSESPSVEVL
jgi:hypothetical protein